MANFYKPSGAGDGYVEKTPYGLSFVRVPLSGLRIVGFFEGAVAGGPLWINFNDFDSSSCPAVCRETSTRTESRTFEIKGRALGSTMLEARLGGRKGSLWDSVQIVVARPFVRTGPTMGHNGSIPAAHQSRLKAAIDQAWALNQNGKFVEAFRDTVSKLSGTKIDGDAYAQALNRMVINLADTSTDQRIVKGLKDEQIDIKAHALSGPAPAMSFRGEPNIWIRTFAFGQGTRQITSCIMHEAAHVAGAPGNSLAEFALDVIHRAAGLPR